MRRYVNRAVAGLLGALAACAAEQQGEPAVGDAERGGRVLAAHDCGVCHEIPGIPAARGRVGPPLREFRRHVYVAGKFPNTPEMLVAWIKDAPSMAPDTAMPDLPVNDRDARDMAAYLLTLD